MWNIYLYTNFWVGFWITLLCSFSILFWVIFTFGLMCFHKTHVPNNDKNIPPARPSTKTPRRNGHARTGRGKERGEFANGDGGFRWVSYRKVTRICFFFRWKGDSHHVHIVSFFWGWTCANRKVNRMGSCAFADFFWVCFLLWIMFF